MLHFLRLIRVKNLLIVIGTQLLMRYCIISPILKVNNFELQFSNLNFILLVLATVLLTAAGYVINDYFDTKTDTVNHPDSVVVGRYVSRRTSITVHTVFNIVAIVIGFYISFSINLWRLGIIYLIVGGILWYYSTTYKRQFLIGNLLVAFLTALVPLMVVLYEIPLLNVAYKATLLKFHIDFNNVFLWVAGFSFFAFITTLIREIIKDIEDFEGDNAYGRNTLPIVLGIFYTKLIVSILIVITLGSLSYIYFNYLNDNISLVYLIIALLIPFILLLYKLIRAKTKSDYHFANILSKVVMLTGLMYSFVVYYMFSHIQ